MKPADLVLTQLQRGAKAFESRVIDLGPVRVARRAYNLALRGEGQAAAGTYVIGVTADPAVSATWGGMTVGAHDIATTRSHIDFCTSGPSSFYTMTVVEGFPWFDMPSGAALARMGPGGSRLRAFLSSAFSRDARASRGPSALIEGLVSVLAAIDRESTKVQPTRCESRRVKAVRECQAYLMEHLAEPVKLTDLSAICGLRPRSLINAFEAVTGMGPMSYLRVARLNRVRSTLQSAGRRQVRVIDVATEWGFWHMGHFAAAYRAMFGESPSETLLKRDTQAAC